jgi:hypothetical protein
MHVTVTFGHTIEIKLMSAKGILGMHVKRIMQVSFPDLLRSVVAMMISHYPLLKSFPQISSQKRRNDTGM